jgi:hypothetical protein
MSGLKETLKSKIKIITSANSYLKRMREQEIGNHTLNEYVPSFIDMLSNHKTELVGLGFTLAYGAALVNYYSNSTFRELAEGGLTTAGKWISRTPYTIPVEHSLEAFKPWYMPVLPPPDSDGFLHLTTRPLLPIIENDYGGVLPGWILSIGKYIIKCARYLKRAF